MPAVPARWVDRLFALVAGAALALAFPAVGAWWWAWAGLVPLLLLVAGADSYGRAAWSAWFAGVGFFGTTLHWLLPHLEIFAAVAIAAAGLFWVPFGIAGYAVLRRPSPARVLIAMVVLPSVWLLAEVVRSWKHLGGAWALLGASQWNVPTILAVASLGGVWLLSFLLVAVNVGLGAALLPRVSPAARVTGAGAALVLVAAAVTYGLARPEPPVTGTMRVAGVQPGDVSGAHQTIAAHLRLTRDLAGAGHDVVVWGQSSVRLNPSRHPDVARSLREAADEADLLVNVDAVDRHGRITKSTYQYTGDGVVARYAKQRLVPFGEYIPLRPLLGWLTEYTRAADKNRSTGDRFVTLSVAGRTVGPLISYESTFSDMRRRLVRMGADVTIVQGSLTTFQGTWAHAQQASYEAVRAVESGRAAVLVELSGTSAAFDSRGGLLAWIPPEQRGTFVVDVPVSAEETPYVRFGDWVPVAAALIVAGARRTADASPGDPEDGGVRPRPAGGRRGEMVTIRRRPPRHAAT